MTFANPVSAGTSLGCTTIHSDLSFWPFTNRKYSGSVANGLPFLNSKGNQIATSWWGDSPDYDSTATLAYCKDALGDVCQRFGGDRERVVLCGFSRGAIAGNYLGLENDEVAGLWRAMFLCSHYDGIRKWSFPISTGQAAVDRLKRLGLRSQFICDEDFDQLQRTRNSITRHHPTANVVFAHTGFRNHSDRWMLRPSEARTKARDWLEATIEY